MRQPRIPIIYAAFNAYITRTSNFLWSDDPDNVGHKQYERLGLTLVQATEWKNRSIAWVALFAKYQDPSQKTLSLIRTCVDFKKAFILYGHPVVNIIIASPNVTQADATIFNFVLTRKQPERPSAKITASVISGLTRIGGGEVVVECRSVGDSKRPSLLPGVDGVEYSYKIVNTQPGDPATVDPEGEGFRQRVISKAKFVFKGGTANKGKFLLIAFRWVYSKYPDLAGSWGEVQVMVLI